MKTWADFGITVPNRGGAERYTTCPQCSSARKKANQKKPCLSLNVEKELWHCHHCGWSGTLKSGVYKRRGDLHWQAPEYWRPNYDAYKGLSDQAIEWFTKRGISKEVLTRNGITTGPVFMPQDDDFTNTIQFPYYRQGQCINIKYRDHHKHFRMEGNCELIFYGLDDRDETMTVIVEGELDKLALETAGIKNCVSVPHGAPAPDSKNYSSKFDFLDNCKEEIAQVKCFVLAVDNDPPGQRLQEELLHRLGSGKCAIAHWPPDCKDANEVLLKHGAETLLTCIYDAEPPPIEGTIRVKDIMDRLETLYEKGLSPGIELGWLNLKNLYKVSQGEWTLITGIPGHGKSEFLDALLVDLAQNHDWTFVIYSPENFPMEAHVAKLLEKKLAKPFRGPEFYKMELSELRSAAAWANNHFVFLNPEERNLGIDALLNLTQSVILRDGARGLVIDPWNELEHQRPSHLTETEYINQTLTRIRRFSRTHNIHTWIVAHPTKLQKDKNGQYPVPTPYDVSGGAHWNNQADNILSVWRDRSVRDSPVQIHIQKIRFKKNGRLGMAHLVYDTLTGQFKDSTIPTKEV